MFKAACRLCRGRWRRNFRSTNSNSLRKDSSFTQSPQQSTFVTTSPTITHFTSLIASVALTILGTAGVFWFLVDCVGYVAYVEGSSMAPLLNPTTFDGSNHGRKKYRFLFQIGKRVTFLTLSNLFFLDPYLCLLFPSFPRIIFVSYAPVFTHHKEEMSLFCCNISLTLLLFDSDDAVLLLSSPSQSRVMVIKRIIGVEGDVVRNLQNNEVVLIPKGHLWIEGDNKHNSLDSRSYGPVSMNLVCGKAEFILFPFSRFFERVRSVEFPERILPHQTYVEFKYHAAFDTEPSYEWRDC